MLYPTANRLCGMSMPDLIAALVAFRAAHGLPYGPADVLACAWRYACAVQDAESAVQA